MWCIGALKTGFGRGGLGWRGGVAAGVGRCGRGQGIAALNNVEDWGVDARRIGVGEGCGGWGAVWAGAAGVGGGGVGGGYGGPRA